jgi:hypothetical protein
MGGIGGGKKGWGFRAKGRKELGVVEMRGEEMRWGDVGEERGEEGRGRKGESSEKVKTVFISTSDISRHWLGIQNRNFTPYFYVSKSGQGFRIKECSGSCHVV